MKRAAEIVGCTTEQAVPRTPVVVTLLAFAAIACKGEEGRRKDIPGETTQPPGARKEAKQAASPQGQMGACQEICKRTIALRCSGVGVCERHCEEMEEIPVCKVQLNDYLRCLGREPAPNWECDLTGIASIKEGYCRWQKAAFVGCLEGASRAL
jgi:hypothetical protein